MVKHFEPTPFGRYLLTERLAVGGMAEIFVARLRGALGFEKTCVVKRMLPQLADNPDFLRMFVTEARLVCHFEHPNIVQVYELDECDRQYFMAMEHVHGIDARQLWRTLAKRRQRLPAVLALFIMAEVLKGLDYAHRAVSSDNRLLGIVHRDVSPSNILISFRGDVKIGDFGVALVQQESATKAGVLKGKYAYMSPEQVAGLAVDHRSDVFAAGTVLTEMLLGRRLFLGRSEFETLDKVLNARIEVLEQHEDTLAPEIASILECALQRDPDARYQSALEFHDDIADYLFSCGERIAQDTLATFVAEHVIPHLETFEDSEKILLKADARSVVHRSAAYGPVVPAGVVPSAAELSPDPVAAPEQREPDDLALPGDADEEATTRIRRFAAEGPGRQQRDEKATGREPRRPTGPQRMMPSGASEGDPRPGSIGYTLDGVEPVASAAESSGELPLRPTQLPGSPRRRGDRRFPVRPPVTPAPAVVSDPPQTERDLSLEIRDEPPTPSVGSSPLISSQLNVADSSLMPREPDYAGSLATRTVTKVLFRFCVVAESGLLTMTGPHAQGRLSGELSWIAQLLRDLHRPPIPTSDDYTCEIHLDRGQPHLLSADRGEGQLVAFLLAEGRLSREDVEGVLRAHPERGLIPALLAASFLAPLHISRHLTSFVIASVLDSFAWTTGTFAFFRDRPPSRESFPTGFDLPELLHRGIARLGEQQLDAYLAPLQEKPLRANEAPPAPLDKFRPSQLVREIHESLGRSPHSASALIAQHQDRARAIEIKRAAYLLLECELAVVGD